MGSHAQEPGATDDPAGDVSTEQLIANPAKYGYVGNGRIAMPADSWLQLIEAFGPANVTMYDEDGDSVYVGAQVSEILQDQVIDPILQQDAAAQQEAAAQRETAEHDCEHPATWHDRALVIWLFAGWLPPTIAATQEWAWAAPGIALWVVTSLIGVYAAIRGAWDWCRRCGRLR